MPRVASIKKIGERLSMAQKRKGLTTLQAMASIGGRTLPTWYRWINGQQEGGCKDIGQLGLFLGLTPDELFLDENEPAPKSPFNAADLAGLENLRKMLDEMTAFDGATLSDERPVAALSRHVLDMLKIMRAKKSGKR